MTRHLEICNFSIDRCLWTRGLVLVVFLVALIDNTKLYPNKLCVTQMHIFEKHYCYVL